MNIKAMEELGISYPIGVYPPIAGSESTFVLSDFLAKNVVIRDGHIVKLDLQGMAIGNLIATIQLVHLEELSLLLTNVDIETAREIKKHLPNLMLITYPDGTVA